MLVEDAHLHFNQEQMLSSINASPFLYLLHEFIHTPLLFAQIATFLKKFKIFAKNTCIEKIIVLSYTPF